MNNCLLKSFELSSLGLGGCLGAFVQLYKQLMLVLTLVEDVVRCVFYTPFCLARTMVVTTDDGHLACSIV